MIKFSEKNATFLVNVFGGGRSENTERFLSTPDFLVREVTEYIDRVGKPEDVDTDGLLKQLGAMSETQSRYLLKRVKYYWSSGPHNQVIHGLDAAQLV